MCRAHPCALNPLQFQFDLPPGGPLALGPAVLGQVMQQLMEQLLGPNGPGAAAAPAAAAGGGGLGGAAAGLPAGGFPLPPFPLAFDWGDLFFDDEDEEEAEGWDGDFEEEVLSDSDVEEGKPYAGLNGAAAAARLHACRILLPLEARPVLHSICCGVPTRILPPA